MPGPRGESFYVAELDGRTVFVGPAMTMWAVFRNRVPTGTRCATLTSEPYEVALVPVVRYRWREDGDLEIVVPEAPPVRLIDRRPAQRPKRLFTRSAVPAFRTASLLPHVVKVADARGLPVRRRVGPGPMPRISAVQRQMIDYTKARIREQRTREAKKRTGWLRRILSFVLDG